MVEEDGKGSSSCGAVDRWAGLVTVGEGKRERQMERILQKVTTFYIGYIRGAAISNRKCKSEILYGYRIEADTRYLSNISSAGNRKALLLRNKLAY